MEENCASAPRTATARGGEGQVKHVSHDDRHDASGGVTRDPPANCHASARSLSASTAQLPALRQRVPRACG